jgi:hypothetical protein
MTKINACFWVMKKKMIKNPALTAKILSIKVSHSVVADWRLETGDSSILFHTFAPCQNGLGHFSALNLPNIGSGIIPDPE